MPALKDIEAEIYFLKTEEGGRKTPARNNYRPQFYYNEHDWDAAHSYPDVEEVNLGDTVRAYLGFLSPKEHFGKIFIGMEFLVREGTKNSGQR